MTPSILKTLENTFPLISSLGNSYPPSESDAEPDDMTKVVAVLMGLASVVMELAEREECHEEA